jgi:uncharacterized delta-60 repeat protein
MRIVLSVFLFLSILTCSAQFLVPGFSPRVIGSPFHSIIEDAQGNILVYGQFDYLNGEYVGSLGRLKPDGRLDKSFKKIFTDGLVGTVSILADSRIMISGSFTTINGVSVPHMVRLFSNGSIDNSFTLAPGVPTGDFKIQSTGKIVARVPKDLNFLTFIRINVDGTLDETFQPPSSLSLIGFSDWLIGPDDGIYYADQNSIGKLGPNGQIDASFDKPYFTPSYSCYVLKLRNNGKIVLGGAFTELDGSSVPSIAQLNSNGTKDSNFQANDAVADFSDVFAIEECENGDIVVGGTSSSNDDNDWAGNAFRLNAHGIVVKTVGHTMGMIRDIVETDDGGIILSGTFTPNFYVKTPGLTKIRAGSEEADEAYNGTVSLVEGRHEFQVNANGSVVIGGGIFYGAYAGSRAVVKSLAKFNAFGSYEDYPVENLDFNRPEYFATGTIDNFFLQRDDKMLCSSFAVLQGTSKRLIRINEDGSPDLSFDCGIGPKSGDHDAIFTSIKHVGNFLYASGEFDSYNGVPSTKLIVLNMDGSVRTTFNSLPPVLTQINKFEVQSDGKIVAYAMFSGPAQTKLIRFNTDGTIDHDFSDVTFTDSPGIIKVDADDRIYIASITEKRMIGSQYLNVLRLLPDGQIDPSFTGLAGLDYLNSIETLPDGNLAVGGNFQSTEKSFIIFNEYGEAVNSEFYDFAAGSFVRHIIYSNNALYMSGRFARQNPTDVYGLVKFRLIPGAVPSAPSTPKVALSDPNVFEIKWADESTDELGFIIERAIDGSDEFAVIDTVPANYSMVRDSIVHERSYSYRIKAVNESGSSPYSPTVTSKWVPEILNMYDPRFIDTDPTTLTTTFTWTHRTPLYALGYIIERSMVDEEHYVFVDSVPVTVNNIRVSIPPGKKMFYRVSAYNSGGKSEAYGNWIKLKAKPKTPSNLKVYPSASGSYTITWLDNSDIEDGFIIEERMGKQGQFLKSHWLDSNATTVSSTSINQQNIFYYFRAVAYNGGIDGITYSEYSNTDSIAIATAPRSLNVSFASSNILLLSWYESSVNELGFIVERSKDFQDFNWTTLDTIPPNSITYYDTIAGPLEKFYSYRIKAFTAYGETEYSNIFARFTEAFPKRPEDLKVVNEVANVNELSWTYSNFYYAHWFIVERAESDDLAFTKISRVNGLYNYNDTVTEQSVYYYRIAAVNELGMSYSDTVRVNIVTGLVEVAEQIEIFPNPAQTIITVRFANKAVGGNWALVSDIGTVTPIVPLVSDDKAIIDIEKMNPGIYILQFQINEKIYRRRLKLH